MALDTARFREILTSLHPEAVSSDDAETITGITELLIDADGREDPDEIAMFFALGKAVFEMAGRTDTPSPTFMGDDDDQGADGDRLRSGLLRPRLSALVAKLTSTSARELAFACAHLLSISDLDVAPAEDSFMGDLRDALMIAVERGDEIAAHLNAVITPPA